MATPIYITIPEHIIQPSPEKCIPKLIAYIKLRGRKLNRNIVIYRSPNEEIMLGSTGFRKNTTIHSNVITIKCDQINFMFILSWDNGRKKFKLYS